MYKEGKTNIGYEIIEMKIRKIIHTSSHKPFLCCYMGAAFRMVPVLPTDTLPPPCNNYGLINIY